MKSFLIIVPWLVISGALLGAGFTEGTVYILDAMSLESEIPEPFKYSRTSVTHISFSHDSQYMATAVSILTERHVCSGLTTSFKATREEGCGVSAQGSRIFSGVMKMLQIHGDGCTTLNTLKPTELSTFNEWFVWDMNSAPIKLV